MMNKRKWIRWTAVTIPFLLLLVFALTYIPHKVVSLKPADVSEICIYDGKSVKIIEITDKNEIKRIITDLNSITFQKGKPSFGFIGFSFNTIILDQKGKEIKELTIITNETIKYNGFFYKSINEKIDYDFIEGLASK